MKSRVIPKIAVAVSAMSLAASPIAIQAAMAQDYGPPQGGQYDNSPNGPPNGYDQNQPPPNDNGYNNGGPNDDYYDNGQPPPPPPGYNGDQPPPPPPGYQPPPDQGQTQAEDARYAHDAEMWARENCVQSHGNVAAGALIGGVFGAILGGAIGGHHSGGVAVGALAGGTAGAAIAANSSGGETSPGCPPGDVLRDGSPGFVYTGYAGPYVYAAPGWYRPWAWYGGRWVYRPYPYHVWYYHHYYGHGGHWRH
jgi:hypothetical protein